MWVFDMMDPDVLTGEYSCQASGEPSTIDDAYVCDGGHTMSNTFIPQGLYSSDMSGLVVNGVDHLEAKTFIIVVFSVREDETTGLFSEFEDGEDDAGINLTLYEDGAFIETRGGG